jgi:hypothetical protein
LRISPRSSTERRYWLARTARLGRLALVTLLGLATPAAVASAMSAAAATAPTSAELRGRAAEVLADRRYQRRLPGEESSGKPGSLPNLPREAGGGGVPPGALPETFALPLAGLSTLAQVVCWVLLAAAAVLALLGLIQALPACRPLPATPSPESPERPERSAEPRLGDPAALAAQGRYGEAVHALLLAAIALLARRFRLPLPPSRTSRELLRALPLQGAAREAFAGLVGTVERSWFGGAPVGPEEYAASVERFRAVEGRGA